MTITASKAGTWKTVLSAMVLLVLSAACYATTYTWNVKGTKYYGDTCPAGMKCSIVTSSTTTTTTAATTTTTTAATTTTTASTTTTTSATPTTSTTSTTSTSSTPTTSSTGGTVYYVSTSGNDANDGLSTNTPWATLAKAASTVTSSGAIIALKKGDIWSSTAGLLINHGGSSGAPIVWDGGLWGSGSNAVIQSSGNRSGAAHNASVVNIAGTSYVTFQNITVDGNNTQTVGLTIGGPDNYHSIGAVQNAERYITIQDSTIKNCGDGTNYQICLLVQTWHNDIANITIQRNTFDGADDETLSFYSGRSNLGATPAETRDSYIGYNTITNYGRRKTTTGMGLQINNKQTNVLIEYNTITTGASGYGPGIMIENNEPLVAYFPTNVTVRYNDVRVTIFWALYIHLSRAKTVNVYYNKFVNTTSPTDSAGGGIAIMNNDPTTDYTGALLIFYNNVIYATRGKSVYDASQTIGVVNFRNNIVYNAGSDTYNDLCVYVNKAGSMVHSNNALFRSAGAAMMTTVEAGVYTSRSNVSTWEPTVVSTDPLLVSPTTFDFRLQSSSPATGKGVFVGLTRDIVGSSVPQNTPALGAYQP